MSNVVVVGAQWGDEGKAKVIDLLSERADAVVRCQGGCNAGHTVQFQGEVFKFHLIPSGILYPHKSCMVGSGVVIDMAVLWGEMQAIQERGFSVANLKISDRAHVTLPVHVAADKVQEALRDRTSGSGKIGTTARGIGPTYADKVSRLGIRICDLYLPDAQLKPKIAQQLAAWKPLLHQAPELGFAFTPEELLAHCHTYAERLAPYVCDGVATLHQWVEKGWSVLFEGAQGALLDVDYGTYPFVTSSNTTSGGACTGSGLGPTRMDAVVGVTKAYLTRVGSGPFPTELTDAVGEHLRTVGQEVGTTTGRPRRCGWFDAVVAKFATQINGLDGLAITKLDVFDGLTELKIGIGYRHRQTGNLVQAFPASLETLAELEPVYETLPGWQGSIKGLTRADQLPPQAHAYLDRLSQVVGVPIWMVSTGPDRDETIVLHYPIPASSTVLA
jgi:adenylosuccinate synthase